MDPDGTIAMQADSKRGAQDGIGGTQLIARRAIHRMDYEVACIENQLVARGPLEIERYGAFQHFAVKMNIEIQMQMPGEYLVRPRIRMQVHYSKISRTGTVAPTRSQRNDASGP